MLFFDIPVYFIEFTFRSHQYLIEQIISQKITYQQTTLSKRTNRSFLTSNINFVSELA